MTRKWVLALAFIVVFALPASTEPGNRMAQYAGRSGVRGYTCENWNTEMSPVQRVAYLLGVIAMTDALRHAAADDTHSLTQQDFEVLRLPRSANDYGPLVSAACASLPGPTPVLVALYNAK